MPRLPRANRSREKVRTRIAERSPESRRETSLTSLGGAPFTTDEARFRAAREYDHRSAVADRRLCRSQGVLLTFRLAWGRRRAGAIRTSPRAWRAPACPGRAARLLR